MGSFFRVIRCIPWFDSFLIRNTILYFLVFYALFFCDSAVILYLTKGYVEKSRRSTFASFASLPTLALALFFKNP